MPPPLTLSPSQEQAVVSDSPAIVVVAGAGSGKTEIVAHRIERLLQASRSDDYRVLAMSYTVKAADELRGRLAQRLGDLHRRVDADTIHGFALSLLRQHGTRVNLPPEPEVISRLEDRVELLSTWLVDGGRSVPIDLPEVIGQLDLARAKVESAPFLDDMRDALAARGAIDFPGMLELATELVEDSWLTGYLKRIYGQLVVDEAQNLTRAQYRLLTGVIGAPNTAPIQTMLVGDERQSIVGFAGADRSLMARFISEYGAERIELHTNYRSAQRIIDLGRRVAKALGQPSDASSNVQFPAPGSVTTQLLDNEPEEGVAVATWISRILTDGLDPAIAAPGETTFVQPDQIAVIARGSASLRFTRNALDDLAIEHASGSTEDDWVTSTVARVVVDLVAHRSAPDHVTIRRHLTALCGYPDGRQWSSLEDLLMGAPQAEVSVLVDASRTDTPAEMMRAVEGLTIDDPEWTSDLGQLLDAWSTFIDTVAASGVTFGNFRQHILRMQRGDTMGSGVRLLTVHKAQGREFKAVAIVACNDGQFPDFRATADEALDEELRAFYVAVSRPSRALLLTRAGRRETRYGYRSTVASPFLELVLGSEPTSSR